MKKTLTMLALFAACISGTAMAQQLDTHFSCSSESKEYDEPVTYADSARIKLDENRIIEFSWESSLFRTTHGFDCSIDLDDRLQAEVHGEGEHAMWRISPVDATTARIKRGYDFNIGSRCSIRLERDGNVLQIKPTCPALCGARANFATLAVDMNSGMCRYESKTPTGE
jgi:hypothetical protein